MADGYVIKAISILFSIGFFLLAKMVRQLAGTWYHPSALFALMWGFFTVVPMIIIYMAPINPFSILYILSCGVIFAIPVLITKNHFIYREFRSNQVARIKHLKSFETKFLDVVLVISSCLGVVFCFWTMLINGWTLTDLLFDLLATSGRFAALRGNEGMEYGLIGSLGVLFTYVPASLGGLIYSANSRTGSARVSTIFFAMTPAVLTMVVQSSKLIFLIAACFFVSGLLINNLYGLREIRINAKLAKFLLKLFAIFFPLVLISFISREHYGDLDDISKTIDVLVHAFASYALGQIYAFSDFFSYYIGMDSASIYNQDYYRMGAYTFTSIAEIFGANVDFPPGLYLETGRYGEIFETNVFTFFRGLILDFEIIGSLMLFFIFGLFSHVSFIGVLKLKNKILSNLLYMHIIVFLFMTYLISVFMARYMYINFAVLFMILYLNSLRSRFYIFLRKI
jgi:oligosaccharide repeat unit polymerase